MKKKKCLFIVNRNFWPPNSGHEVVLFNYCKELCDKYNYDIILYIFDSPKNNSEIPYFIKKVIYASSINKIQKILGVIKAFYNRNPLQRALMDSNKNQILLKSIASKSEYELIIVDMIRLAHYIECFKNLSVKKILILEDLLSDRYQRIKQNKNSKGNLLGYYSNTFPKFISYILNHKLVKDKILDYESKAVEREQEKYILQYDYCTLIAQKDVDYINNKFNFHKAKRLACGVDIDYFSAVSRKVDTKNNELCFLGNMYVAANQDSVRYIVENILGKINHKVIFSVIGSVPDSFCKEFENNKNIRFLGRVEDIREICARCKLFLAPISYGTGVKTKIIEAMAMGIPVITNSIGAESISAINNQDFICEDDDNILACRVDELLSNFKLAEFIGAQGQKFVNKNFDWNIVFKAFDEMGV